MSDSPATPRSLTEDWPGKALTAWFVRNPVAANLLMVLFLVGGALSAATLPTEVFPSLSPRSVQIAVIYPGATPGEVEESVTRRVEEAVRGLDGVDRVRSVASEGRGTVTVILRDFADAQVVRTDVETAVNGISNFPPQNAEQPQIRVPLPTTTVLTLALTGPVSEAELRRAGEQAENELLALEGISTALLRGVREYEIAISVSEQALRRFDLSFSEVADAVRAGSVDLSGGEIRTAGGDILLRTDARRITGEAFESIIVRSDPSGARVRLSDVASITDGFREDPLISLYQGRPAVFLDVLNRPGEDLLTVRRQVDAWQEEAILPAGVDVSLVIDQSVIFADRIALITRNAILGFTLVFVFLVLMLDLRLAFWVALSVPISFLGGFAVFGAAGVSMNFITTFGLIIVLGIVVDAAIVVGENTDRERAKGRTGRDAAIAGVTGVAAPVLVGVLTTIAAFGPLIFTGGTFGEITRPIPIVVVSILAVSLVAAFLILPSQLSSGSDWSRGPLARLQGAVQGAVQGFSDGAVRRWALFAARARLLVSAGGIVILIAIMAIPATGLVRFVFFPAIEAELISADLRLPEGAPFGDTRAAAEAMIRAAEEIQAEYAARGEPVIRTITATIGGRTSQFGGPGSSVSTTVAGNLAQVELVLEPAARRSIRSSRIESLWRERFGPLPGVERLTIISTAGPQDPDIAYEMTHPDDETLERAVLDLAAFIGDIEGARDINNGFDLGKRQLNFALTPAGEAAGLTPADIARQVRQAFFGEEVQRIQRGRDEVRVFVRYPEAERRDLTDLDALRLRTREGRGLPLSAAAAVTETRSYTRIERIDGRRIIEVTANVDTDVITPGSAREQVEDFLPELIERYPGLTWELAGAGREQAQDFASLLIGLLFAVIIMYALLATQLRSYIQPLIILIAIPFGVAGAILGHLMLGFDLSFPSIFGMVALSGVVVNASIVLIDRYNKTVESGVEPREAIAEACARRFRPVVITTLTTALGLLPIMSEQSPQAQFLVPMVVSLGVGLMFASVAILMLLPAFVMVIEDVRDNALAQWGMGAFGVFLIGLMAAGPWAGLAGALLVAGIYGLRRAMSPSEPASG
ncbi:efflux RND transporter permease subunit [Alkalicaulis satelles]|uniref:Efflux RND transporter permease subunit n=1 Tax=Alkalicaulis satelles TaxID=2609175 RepID=A0A5M6ZJ03_9PROT|nr:efflux RND transporter permease subunit [Alkalicaulis satelles]KAA5802201.1 efflux RND transporter permease subunit [Alkalicaulis satelles]